jgi:WD40 repeat protein
MNKLFEKNILQSLLLISLFGLLIGIAQAQSVSSIAFLEISPNGHFVAGVGNLVIRIWDTETGLLLNEILQEEFVSDVSWSPDSSRLVTVTASDFVRIWNIDYTSEAIGTMIGEFEPNLVIVETAAWSPDSRYIAIAGGFQTNVQLWDAYTYELYEILPWSSVASRMVWNPNVERNLLAEFSTQDCCVSLISGSSIQQPILACRECVMDAEIRDVRWNSTGTQLAIASSDGLIQIMGIDTNQRTLLIETSGGINVIAWNARGSIIANTTYDGINRKFEFWDTTTGNLLASVAGSYLMQLNPLNDDLIYIEDYRKSEQIIITPISVILPSETTIHARSINSLKNSD